MLDEDLFQMINEFRKTKLFLSNAFFTKTNLDKLLANENTQCFATSDLILLLEEEKDLFRVYFFAKNILALERISNLMPKLNKPIVADIVGRQPDVETLAKSLNNNGFEQYSIFVRMTCDNPGKLDNIDFSNVEYAKEDDVNAIIELLYSEFDPLFSHIPPLVDILTAISKKEITIIRVQQQLAGFAFFEEISFKSFCLRCNIILFSLFI